MTRSWGLEVDRVELSMEAVLQPPRESPLAAVPPVPRLDGTIQQLAAHFFSSTLALAGSGTGAPEAGNQSASLPGTSLLAGDPVSFGCLTQKAKSGRYHAPMSTNRGEERGQLRAQLQTFPTRHWGGQEQICRSLGSKPAQFSVFPSGNPKPQL